MQCIYCQMLASRPVVLQGTWQIVAAILAEWQQTKTKVQRLCSWRQWAATAGKAVQLQAASSQQERLV